MSQTTDKVFSEPEIEITPSVLIQPQTDLH